MTVENLVRPMVFVIFLLLVTGRGIKFVCSAVEQSCCSWNLFATNQALVVVSFCVMTQVVENLFCPQLCTLNSSVDTLKSPQF